MRIMREYARIIRTRLCLLTVTLVGVGSAAGQPAGDIRRDTSLSAEQLIQKAEDARDAKRFEEEYTLLRSAYRAEPDNVHVLWRLTRSSAEAGELTGSRDERRQRFFEAMQFGKQAIRADSTHHLGYIWLAIAEAAVASVEGLKTKVRLSWNIRQHAEKAIELNPEFDSGYHILARWHHEVAGIGGVKRTLAKVFLGELPEASYDEAIRLYKKAIEINDLIHHRLALVQTYMAAGEEEKAREELNIILSRPSEKRLDDRHKADARQLLAQLD